MMSSPPTSLPSPYSCGYVGQLEYFFRPCRTSSSDRMSNVSKRTCASCSSPTAVREKPQRGASGVPFMKSTTGALWVSARSRSSSGTIAPPTGEAASAVPLPPPDAIPDGAGPLPPPAAIDAVRSCCLTLLTSVSTSAPTSVSATMPLRKKMNAGTDSSPNRSHRSGKASASSCTKTTFLCSAGNSAKTALRCAHGSAHAAQKLATHASELARSASAAAASVGNCTAIPAASRAAWRRMPPTVDRAGDPLLVLVEDVCSRKSKP